MSLLLPFWRMRRKAFNLKSWFIPRKRRKMTNKNVLSPLSSPLFSSGMQILWSWKEHWWPRFKAFLTSQRFKSNEYRRHQTGLGGLHAWTFPPGNHCRDLSGPKHILYQGEADLSLVSLGCHCTELLRNYLCKLNKRLPHCTPQTTLWPSCVTFCCFPQATVIKSWLPGIVKGVHLWPVWWSWLLVLFLPHSALCSMPKNNITGLVRWLSG